MNSSSPIPRLSSEFKLLPQGSEFKLPPQGPEVKLLEPMAPHPAPKPSRMDAVRRIFGVQPVTAQAPQVPAIAPADRIKLAESRIDDLTKQLDAKSAQSDALYDAVLTASFCDVGLAEEEHRPKPLDPTGEIANQLHADIKALKAQLKAAQKELKAAQKAAGN